MAKTTRELGLFVPPEKERQLHELDELDVEQKGRVRRRMMFRWMGWGAVLVLLGQWSIGFISFFTPTEMLTLARDAGFRDAQHVSAATLAQRYFAGRTDGLRPPNNSEELLVATT